MNYFSENEALLFYYTNESKIPQRTDAFVPVHCKNNNTDLKSNDIHCKEYDGSKMFNLSGIYLNERKEFSMTLLKKSVWDQTDGSWRHWKKIPSWNNVRIMSGAPQIDMFYTDETTDESTVPVQNIIKRRWKRVSRDGSIQSFHKEGDKLLNIWTRFIL